MANSLKYIYGEQFANTLPGSNQNFYFRTVTSYEVDNNGRPIDGSAVTALFYAPKPAARTSDGKTWTPGTADSIATFDQGGWVYAATTRDKGRTYGYSTYTQKDADLGRIPFGKNVGDEVLGATTKQSLTTSGGRFYDAVQNNLINLSANTQPGLAQVVSAKQANTVQSTQPPAQPPSPTQPSAPAPAPSPTPTPIPIDNGSGDLEIGESLEIAPVSGLRYPKDMTFDQNKIKFIAVEIVPSGNLTGEITYKAVDGPVYLAMQAPISDQNSVDWGPDTVNSIDAAIFQASLGEITADKPLGQETGDMLKRAYSGLFNGTQQERAKRYLAGLAASLNNVLARTDGVILNPNLELLFQGPQLRPFTFQFKMSARRKEEADDIKKIIKYFKYHMAVRKEKGIFLRAPHVFTIQYMKNDSVQHSSIGKISKSDNEKACALTNCSVDYTPLGSYMTYDGQKDPEQTMVAYTISLQFQEITPVYDVDYADGHSIGY